MAFLTTKSHIESHEKLKPMRRWWHGSPNQTQHSIHQAPCQRSDSPQWRGIQGTLVGAGVIQGMDNRDSDVSTSGLYQAFTYSSWLLSSIMSHDFFPTVSTLMKQWKPALVQGLFNPEGNQTAIYADVNTDLSEKTSASFPSTVADLASSHTCFCLDPLGVLTTSCRKLPPSPNSSNIRHPTPSSSHSTSTSLWHPASFHRPILGIHALRDRLLGHPNHSLHAHKISWYLPQQRPPDYELTYYEFRKPRLHPRHLRYSLQ